MKKIKKFMLIVLSLILGIIALGSILMFGFGVGSQRAMSPVWEPLPIEFREVTSETEGYNRDVLERVNNEASLEQLITETTLWTDIWLDYEFRLFDKLGTLVEVPNEGRVRRADLYEIDELLGIEALRRMDNGDVYAVFEIEGRGRMFLFFPQVLEYQLSHIIYINQPNVGSDFDTIRTGISFENYMRNRNIVALNSTQIDCYDRNLNETYYFLLKNTLLIVRIDEYRYILEIERRSDKRIHLPAGAELNGRILEEDEVFDFNILPQDFPQVAPS